MKKIKEILKELKSKQYNILLDELEELFVELEKIQLYKEDFEKECNGFQKYDYRQYCDDGFDDLLDYDLKKCQHLKYILKDNSKYDKLPSKEDK